MVLRTANSDKLLHAVIIPFPAQGHVTPCLQLARKLIARHGFRITFVNTVHIHERFMKCRSSTAMQPDDHEGVEFVTVSDGLPVDHPRLRDMTSFCTAILEMGPAFEALLTNLVKKSTIDCVIRDMFITRVDHAAHKLDIPVAVFGTASTISTHCCYHIDTFVANGILPIPPPPSACGPTMNAATLTLAMPQSDAEAAARAAPLTCLPGASPSMRLEDVPSTMVAHDLENFFIRYFQDHVNPLAPEAACVFYNTSSALEGSVLDSMRGSMNANIFAVGPLVLGAKDVDGVEEVSMAGVGSGLWDEDPVSISWLDKQEPNSVLFVSFGSIATVSKQQLREFAAGLEASNVAFLWVVRPDLIDKTSENQEYDSMFTEFGKRTQNRALMVPWAPQTAVLSHPAVVAFLTHCGWNSTIESISSGVPMLGWPRFGDQSTNCHYVTSVWKIGLELRQSRGDDGAPIVLKEEIIAKVKKIMSEDSTDEEVAEIRKNCRNEQMAALKAVAKGGSSLAALTQFVELISSRTNALKIL